MITILRTQFVDSEVWGDFLSILQENSIKSKRFKAGAFEEFLVTEENFNFLRLIIPEGLYFVVAHNDHNYYLLTIFDL